MLPVTYCIHPCSARAVPKANAAFLKLSSTALLEEAKTVTQNFSSDPGDIPGECNATKCKSENSQRSFWMAPEWSGYLHTVLRRVQVLFGEQSTKWQTLLWRQDYVIMFLNIIHCFRIPISLSRISWMRFSGQSHIVSSRNLKHLPNQDCNMTIIREIWLSGFLQPQTDCFVETSSSALILFCNQSLSAT